MCCEIERKGFILPSSQGMSAKMSAKLSAKLSADTENVTKTVTHLAMSQTCQANNLQCWADMFLISAFWTKKQHTNI